ncbi:HSP70 and/or MreB Mbl domain containing protein, partial [Asbolus verrucosus]
MEDLVVGIDLGTTNCCVAYFLNGRIKILENREGGRITPSYVFLTEKNASIVGSYAKYIADSKPECGIYGIKRLIGRKFDDPHVQKNLKYFPFQIVGDSNEPVVLSKHTNKTIKRTPQELCTSILAKIKRDVEQKLGMAVDKAVITVPAYFDVKQRQATLEAATAAGFTVMKLLNEPTAAALNYYFENDCEENYSLVYDLGGGTFDVAILKRSSGNIDIIAVDGDNQLGGQDFDNLIVDHVCEELRNNYNYNPKSEIRAMRKIRSKCEKAKEILSLAEDTVIILDGIVQGHDTVEIDLTRHQFEEMADHLFWRTIEIVTNCLKYSNVPKTKIDDIILSGGSTRIPKLQTMISDCFGGKALNKCINPDESVAEGAALQAAMLSQNLKQQLKKIRISDVTPLSLGTCDHVSKMTFFIKRNTPIPISQTISFVNVRNQQDNMHFNLYEGERQDARKNRHVAHMTISNLTPSPPRQCRVSLTMNIDHNGIIKLEAKEELKNNTKDLKIVYSRGFTSDREVKNALKDAEDHKDEDEQFRRFAALKMYLLDYCEIAASNFESKNLTELYSEEYEFFTTARAAGEAMEMSDQSKLYRLISKAEFKGQHFAWRFGFDFS